MKNVLRKFAAGCLLLALLGTPAYAQTRIGTVDLRKVFDNYWKRKQADAAIKERAAELEKQHNEMVAGYKKSTEDYQTLLASAGDQVVSSEERDKRKKQAEDKLRQLRDTEEAIKQFERNARTTVDDQLNRTRDKILEEIRTVVNAKAQAGNFSLVIDTAAESANKTPIVLYVNSKEGELTDAVLAQLNAAAPVDALKPDDKKADDKKTDDKKNDKKK